MGVTVDVKSVALVKQSINLISWEFVADRHYSCSCLFYEFDMWHRDVFLVFLTFLNLPSLWFCQDTPDSLLCLILNYRELLMLIDEDWIFWVVSARKVFIRDVFWSIICVVLWVIRWSNWSTIILSWICDPVIVIVRRKFRMLCIKRNSIVCRGYREVWITKRIKCIVQSCKCSKSSILLFKSLSYVLQ